jgi:hypothetical protein
MHQLLTQRLQQQKLETKVYLVEDIFLECVVAIDLD